MVLEPQKKTERKNKVLYRKITTMSKKKGKGRLRKERLKEGIKEKNERMKDRKKKKDRKIKQIKNKERKKKKEKRHEFKRKKERKKIITEK